MGLGESVEELEAAGSSCLRVRPEAELSRRLSSGATQTEADRGYAGTTQTGTDRRHAGGYAEVLLKRVVETCC